MRIKTIITQHRRDFTATLKCEHCGAEQHLRGGYDDAYYHQNVIPNIECDNCGKKASDSYRPLTTKYKEGEVV